MAVPLALSELSLSLKPPADPGYTRMSKPRKPASGWVAHALHSDLLRLADVMEQQHAATSRQRDEVLAVLQRAVEALWPGACVEVFGSYAVGLATPSSNLDVLVLHVPSEEGVSARQHQAACAQLLAERLKHVPGVGKLKVFHRSAIPLVSASIAPLSAALAPPGAAEVEKEAGREGGAEEPQPLLNSRSVWMVDVSFEGAGHYGLAAVQLMQARTAIQTGARGGQAPAGRVAVVTDAGSAPAAGE